MHIDSTHHYSLVERRLRVLDQAAGDLRHSKNRGSRAVTTFVTATVGATMAHRWFIPRGSLTGNDWLDVVANVVVALAAAVAFYWLSPDPSKALERLDHLLAAYDPVDAGAYAELQNAVRERRRIEPQRVIDWLQAERSALQRARGPRLPADSKFLARSVGDGDSIKSRHGQGQGERK